MVPRQKLTVEAGTYFPGQHAVHLHCTARARFAEVGSEPYLVSRTATDGKPSKWTLLDGTRAPFEDPDHIFYYADPDIKECDCRSTHHHRRSI